MTVAGGLQQVARAARSICPWTSDATSAPSWTFVNTRRPARGQFTDRPRELRPPPARLLGTGAILG